MATRASRRFLLAYVAFAPLATLLVRDPASRWQIAEALGVACGALALDLWVLRLRGTWRAAWLCAVLLCSALAGYAMVGFLTGPALASVAGLLVARVLIGRGAARFSVFVLCAGLAALGVARAAGLDMFLLPAADTDPGDVLVVLRTSVLGVLVIVTGGQLVGLTVRGMEEALRHNRELVERAEDAVRLRDDFLALASHELRTPLAALRMATEALTQGRLGEDPAARERALRLVHTNAERLRVLVSQLVDVSAVDSGRLQLVRERTDLSRLVREVVARLAECDRSRIEVSLEDGVGGWWDPGRLEQVVTVLLQGALRQGRGRPVELTLRVDPAQAVLLVADHRPAMAAEALERAFEPRRGGPPGQTAHTPDRSGGLAAELFLVRSLAEAHGGRVSARTTPRGSTEFRVELPRAEAPS